MVVDYLNPIIGSFMNVLPQLGLSDIKRMDVSLKDKMIESPGVIVIIGLMGDIKGNIIYSMKVEDAMNIASAMMMGMPVNEMNELAQSAISELVNMLTANVATNFSENDISVNISTPTLITGEFTATASSEKVICIPIKVNDMIVEANVSLEKNTL